MFGSTMRARALPAKPIFGAPAQGAKIVLAPHIGGQKHSSTRARLVLLRPLWCWGRTRTRYRSRTKWGLT